MTRIPVHTVDSAPEGSRDALKKLEAKFGKVLNIHTNCWNHLVQTDLDLPAAPSI